MKKNQKTKKKNQKNLCATMKTKIVKKNQITMRTKKNQCAKKAKTVKTWRLRNQKNPCATMKTKIVKKNQIRTALEEKNFLKVSQLSKAFDEQIKKLTHQLQ